MAFVPFFRPWFGMFFFCILRSLLTSNYLINIFLLVIYYYLSEMIFSKRLKKMEFHQVITNLSVLFGIYQFGIAGIFYGPILLILFKTVEKELLKT
jgi:predicted PurR-regulated permease PerM